jgi:hypothetical protein
MSVIVSAASSYQNALGGLFGHVEVEMNTGASVELSDGSALTMCEFGLIITQPGVAPNQFVPWGSVRRIIEAREQQAAPAPGGDGQHHD